MPRNTYSRRPTLSNEELDPALTEVSRRVIGCAIEIHKALGPGFDASVYENALSNELTDAGVKHHVGHEFPVRYHDREVGAHRIGLFVDDRFIVDVMAADAEVSGFDRSALRALLRAADLELGLIINFHRRRLKDGGLVRVLNPDKIDALRGGRDAGDDEGEDGDSGMHHDDDDDDVAVD